MNEGPTNDRVVLELYPLIKSKYPYWPVIIYGIISIILAISGILMNFAVILVTIRTKSFRGSLNILLAFYSLCEIVNLSGNFLSIFTVFSGQYFMPFKSAFYFVIASVICAGCAVNLMFFMGIERLFGVLFPLRKLNKTLFLAIALIFNGIFFIVSSIIFTKCVNAKAVTFEVFVSMHEIVRIAFNVEKCSFLLYFCAFTMMGCIIVYTLIAITLCCRKVPSNANSSEFNNRIFRSLSIIVIVNFGGYVTGIFCSFITTVIIDNNPMVEFHSMQIAGILLHISAASNGPILYWRSSEYREAYQKELASLLRMLW